MGSPTEELAMVIMAVGQYDGEASQILAYSGLAKGLIRHPYLAN